ncbi:hypothetical protein DFO50_106113 [Microvirgula sp. AG722]|nr:hypothetical protein DFO50_106113 [Microvirgula sp. AG722]
MITQADPATAQRCTGTPTVIVHDNRCLTVRTIRYNRTGDEGGDADECVRCGRGHRASAVRDCRVTAVAVGSPPNGKQVGKCDDPSSPVRRFRVRLDTSGLLPLAQPCPGIGIR